MNVLILLVLTIAAGAAIKPAINHDRNLDK